MTSRRSATLVVACTLLCAGQIVFARQAPASALGASTIHGRVTGPDGRPLPGVSITVTRAAAVPAPEKAPAAVTDEDGRYLIAVPEGRYRVRAELSGFQTIDRDVPVAGEAAVVDLTMALAPLDTQVIVKEEAAAIIGTAQPDAPVTITREVIDNAMLPNTQYDDVLPLMPNVIRGPDGLISVAGASAPQGALVVDGINLSDPITGQAGVMLPIEAVDAVQVYSGGYTADLGRATGGVTTVSTRSGSDQLHWSANDMFPRVFIEHGGLNGVQYWDPNVGVSGPLKKGRVYFAQALSYRYDRNRYQTLAGREEDEFKTLLSWSQVDAQLSAQQHLTASLSFDPQTTDHARITTFTPAASVPRLDQGGWSAAVADRLTVGQASTLEIRTSVIRTRLLVAPDGAMPYEVGHDLARGSYYDSQQVHGTRIETGVVESWTPWPTHVMKVGGTIGRASLDATVQSAPVDLLRSDGTVSRRITFQSGHPIDVSTWEAGLFARDTWAPASWLTVEAGARFDLVTAAATPTLTPRLAWTITPAARGPSVSGSIGLFADKLVLRALAFPSEPPRSVQAIDDAGAPLGEPATYPNQIAGTLHLPRATRWDIELDDRFGGWLARVRYQERHGRDELVINPVGDAAGGSGLLVLDNSGVSTARSIEATLGYRSARAHHEIYTSYVRSSAHGDLNTFDTLNGAFKEPFVQANQAGPLAIDVPNRLLAWGLLQLPLRITVAPFVELRDGFPYSAIDDGWVYVGARNSHRLPWFGSLDLSVRKVFDLPGRLPDARIGFMLYNLATSHGARDVQRDIERADFGTAYNPIPRDYAIVFQLLWGHL